MNLYHTTIKKDDRCIDLLLTEDEIAQAFERALDQNNKSYISTEQCCDCWSIEKPPKCTFWSKILGLCEECEEN